MRSIPPRYRFTFILSHWVLAPLILILLELGWYVQSLSEQVPERNIFTDLHISLGLTSVVIVGILILWRFLFGGPPLPHTVSPWQRKLIQTIYIWIYVGLVVIALSGFLQAVASAIPIRFWGLPLLARGAEMPGLINLFWVLHGAVAFVLTALVVVHLALLLLPRYPSSQASGSESLSKPPSANPPISPEATSSALPPKVVLNLTGNFRRLGWTAFGIQTGFAFISGLLLMFALWGHSFNFYGPGFNTGIFWAIASLATLGLVILFSSYYLQIAPKMVLESDSQRTPKQKLIFGFLGLAVAASLIGALAALTGVVTSLVFLVTKTVSDVLLISLVNFNLLIAHLVSMVITFRVIALTSKARRL